ncbi:cardiolipin synthase ClsB [Chiayiivirga flava]|uniref:Cardiolipin synthase B n=1 Tax=Chiayiivirga flava TaxID=659595 RepID=A0A7W8G126_9GAMM|nr:cardiolipin synthase ClsB [Chiayiivirga flava]MBB5209766.1 cardiolipin synthase [Chiayiivirga flava]
MKTTWHHGNRVELLENGEGFYPAVFDAIRGATREVIIETFILFEDKVGEELRQAMIAAANNGASVEITIDGFGSPEFSVTYLESLRAAGVRIRVFDPRPRLFGLRTHWFRRLHRKIVVVDGKVAFVGGINFSADHLADFGPEAKQDYSIRVEGPAVDDIRAAARALIDPAPRPWHRRRRAPAVAAPAREGARVAFVIRDNGRHRDDIERHYRAAIRAARKRIVIANAYFVPGYRILKGLRDAARRGVEVQLILQGHPDMPWVTAATRSLYRYLLPAGVKILEYCRRPLHGKVALVDDTWATVGSSNLDPLSLAMNLEANVLVQDAAFNAHLHERLQALASEHCTPVTDDDPRARGVLRPLMGVVLFHLLRHFPRLLGLLPAHVPTLPEVVAQTPPASSPASDGPAPDADPAPVLEHVSSYRATQPPRECRREHA